MLINILFAVIILLSSHNIKSETEVTLPIGERIKLLKFKIVQSLKRHSTFEDKTTLVNENLDYVNIEAITPISRGDVRIKDQNYMLPLLKTKITTTVRPWDNEPEEKIYDDINKKIIVLKKKGKGDIPEEITKSIRIKKKPDSSSEELNSESVTAILKKKPKVQPKDNTNKDKFKRNKEGNKRNESHTEKHERKDSKNVEANENERKNEITDEKEGLRRQINKDFMDTQIQGVHCQRVITPHLVGVKKSFDPPIRVTFSDRIVKRFLELIKTNVTGFTKDDTYALLYQISETQVRLFQWDISAIRMLFNAVAGDDQRHTFKSLKYGIRKKFKAWHLDSHWNTTALLMDTLLFRPYCVDHRSAGSTKSSRVSRFIKSTTPTTDVDDCD